MLAAGGGLLVGALTPLAWVHRTAVERGSGAAAGPPTDLTLWDLGGRLAAAVVAVAAMAVLLSLLRVGPWLIGAAGVTLIAVLGWGAATWLGQGSPACCETIRTSSSPLVPFGLAALGSVSVLAGGLWARTGD